MNLQENSGDARDEAEGKEACHAVRLLFGRGARPRGQHNLKQAPHSAEVAPGVRQFISQNVFINQFCEVNPPTKSSTYC